MAKDNKKKVYKSMAQIEKDLFPELHKRNLAEEKVQIPVGKSHGTGLATEILNNIKNQLKSS